MQRRSRFIVYSAIIAAMYAALCHLQNLLIPGSASWAIQLRVAEALCVLAYFTPTAVPGLTLGCLVFNLTSGSGLPLDPLVGTLASLLSAGAMRLLRGHPFPGLLMPALFNAVLVGWELELYLGGGFWLNALYVALGEGAVLLVLGSLLYTTIKKRGLAQRIFGDFAC